jgi:hypothetical protein
VRGHCEAHLVREDSEVELGLDHPQPVVGVERVIRVAEGGGLRRMNLSIFLVRSSSCGAARFPPLPWCSKAYAILCIK